MVWFPDSSICAENRRHRRVRRACFLQLKGELSKVRLLGMGQPPQAFP
jgi:hypothetical protein